MTTKYDFYKENEICKKMEKPGRYYIKWNDLDSRKNESLFLHGQNSKDSKYKGMHALEQSEGHMW